VVPPNHQGLNPNSTIWFLIKAKYSFSARRRFIDSEVVVVTSSILDPPAQSFRGVYRSRVCMRVFKGMGVYSHL
jgi:hypothetical protein